MKLITPDTRETIFLQRHHSSQGHVDVTDTKSNIEHLVCTNQEPTKLSIISKNKTSGYVMSTALDSLVVDREAHVE